MEKNWRQKWQEAYERANFYDTQQNTPEYWNEVAAGGSAGLPGDEHIKLLIDFLLEKGYMDDKSRVLDVGCGCGDYALAFASYCSEVTGVDNASGMIGFSRDRCEKAGINNVSFLEDDVYNLSSGNTYDIVMANLNPAVYCPDGLDKLMELSCSKVVYFTMDTPLEGSENEPVYRGTNSVLYAENYLNETGIKYHKVPFVYDEKIPFAYLIVDLWK